MDNSEVKLDIPVQYEFHNSFWSTTDWYDCVVTEDGLSIITGLENNGRQYPLDQFKLRNTPLIWQREIDVWFSEEIRKLTAQRDHLMKSGKTRLAAVKFKYKSKTQLKKERKVSQ